MRRILFALLVVAAVAVLPAERAPGQATSAPAAAARRAGPPRVFVQIKGDLWRASNGNWWSLIYVTPDGILLADPLNTEHATWLKGELAKRFPDKPVRYIV